MIRGIRGGIGGADFVEDLDSFDEVVCVLPLVPTGSNGLPDTFVEAFELSDLIASGRRLGILVTVFVFVVPLLALLSLLLVLACCPFGPTGRRGVGPAHCCRCRSFSA